MSSGGQVVGGLVGAVVGFFTGGPTGALYGAQVGMMAGGYLNQPKGPTINGPRLDDLSVQTSTYGAVIPRLYGTITVNGNVFWLENNALKEMAKKKKSGGKGGGSSAGSSTYSYSATFAVGLCQGPIDAAAVHAQFVHRAAVHGEDGLFGQLCIHGAVIQGFGRQLFVQKSGKADLPGPRHFFGSGAIGEAIEQVGDGIHVAARTGWCVGRRRQCVLWGGLVRRSQPEEFAAGQGHERSCNGPEQGPLP